MAEALTGRIDQLRQSLDHRSLFSSAFNRTLVRKIEVLDSVREEFLVLSRELLKEEQEVIKNAQVTRSASRNPL